MPLPTAKKGEPEKEFVSRCMEFQGKEKDLKDEGTRKQAVAICFKQFKESGGVKIKTWQMILLEKMKKYSLSTKERDEFKKHAAGLRVQCSVAKNESGMFFVYTHRARSKFVKNIKDIKREDIKFISSTS